MNEWIKQTYDIIKSDGKKRTEKEMEELIAHHLTLVVDDAVGEYFAEKRKNKRKKN
jgi:hypothetical protein